MPKIKSDSLIAKTKGGIAVFPISGKWQVVEISSVADGKFGHRTRRRRILSEHDTEQEAEIAGRVLANQQKTDDNSKGKR